MGIRISDEDTSHISPPQITGNNLSGSAQYGIFLRVSNATLQGSDKNKFDGSAYAIGLAGGSYRITNLDFSKSRIGKTALQAQGTRSLIISNCDFTISNSTDQNHFALNLYQVGSANISSVTVSGSDVGISVNTANGVSTNLVLSNSVIQNASLAGIWFRSDDATALGNIQVNNNDLRFNPSGRAVWLTGGVRMNPSPVFSNNQQ